MQFIRRSSGMSSSISRTRSKSLNRLFLSINRDAQVLRSKSKSFDEHNDESTGQTTTKNTVDSSSTLSSDHIQPDEEEEEIDEIKQSDEHTSTTKRGSKQIDPRSLKKCDQIMFLYNSKSGGQKALSLLKYFRAYTTLIYDLFELSSSDSELHKLSDDLQRYQHQIIVCIVGGDGSQCWAASLIDKAIQLKLLTLEMKHVPYPTIIPFPVGTGNDLSRSLGWGHLERKPKRIIKHVADAQFCYNYTKRFSFLDRWGISYIFDDTKDTTQFINDFIPPLAETFLGYLSFGYDAKITYHFDARRNNNPKGFTSQKKNQALYAKLGLKEFLMPSNTISDCVQLEVDGECVDIPTCTRSLKVVNINSAASGIFFWGKRQTKLFKKPKLNDGLLEVMTTTGPRDLVVIKSNLSNANRLRQAKDIRLKIVKTPIYLQIDGEGWCIDKKCTLHIKLYDKLPTLIGYKQPRGVRYNYTNQYYTKKVKKRRHKFRKIIKLKYNIPDKFPKDYDPSKQSRKRKRSVDDSHLGLSGKRHAWHGRKLEMIRLHSMSELETEKRENLKKALGPWYRRPFKRIKKKLRRRKR